MAMKTTRDAVSEAGAERPWRGDDFADWLPPMLVRELRQGLQAGAFFWTFILLQVALALHGVVTVIGLSDEADMRANTRVFFWILAIALGLAIPLRGLNAVAQERVGDTLDLLRLTRLSATRIVVGKWAAIVAQVLLVTVAILPYLAVRYFLGGVNVVGELELLACVVVGSMLVAAGAVALSTLPLWARIGAVVVVAADVGLAANAIVEWLDCATLGLEDRLAVLAGGAVLIVACLEYAASRIAPPSENHAGRMRLTAVALATVLAAVGIFVWNSSAFEATCLTVGPLVLCFAIGALLERPVDIAAIYRPFGRWGALGRLAALVVTPGWATALPFVAIVAGLWMTGWLEYSWREAIRRSMHGPFDGECYWWALACCWLVPAAMVFPLPVLVHFPRLRPRLLIYALVQLACALVFVGVSVQAWDSELWDDGDPEQAEGSNAVASWVITLPFPLAALLTAWQLENVEDVYPTFMRAGVITTLIVLRLVARPWLEEMRRTLRLTRDGDARAAAAVGSF